ncbi:MAG: SPOR domain-containing protein [Paludibacteraceae bacterium]|nr:SPOR domain-containing protein [Paludibacteraceae bacterium]
MKAKSIILVVVASVVVMFTSCKIQDAPGAYQRAKGRITVEELEKQNENKPEVAPTPTPVVREIEEKEVAPKQETVKEPVFVPTPVVTPKSEPTPEVVEEKEVTRAEKFEVIEEQKDEVVLKKYHVVIGSFGNKDNALRLQSQMRPQYNPIIVRNDKGMYRVLLMTYDTYKEAKTKIAEIRDQFPDAWVLVMQNS